MKYYVFLDTIDSGETGGEVPLDCALPQLCLKHN